ncbi:MAG: hypothetical protein GY906_34395, partial [bacterium]|nr:hypothetical protein [bacterium]
GSQITRDRELTLLVHEADGSVPENISVIPLTDGYVGDALGASCNPDGRCRLSGLPTQESTLLVRGSGAALIRLNSPHPEAAVRLHPVVKLRIRPTSTWEHGAIRYRLISDSIDGTVPIIRWLNPDRDSWFEVPAHGLSLYLPSGDYRLEVAADDSPLRVIPIHLDSEDFVEVALD